MKPVYLSVVIPVFNEEANLSPLFTRLTKTLDGTGKSWEVIFVNDGSRDRSLELLRGFHLQRPRQVRVMDFSRNFGQHTAIMAAFERVRGEIIVTLDADLQNPPEEIPKLLAKIEDGCDALGGVREHRRDSLCRRFASRVVNSFREWVTDIHMTDQGCMLRAYRRHVVDAVVRTNERSLYIPALAYKFAANPGEVTVVHAERAAGTSKYSYFKLMRLSFDLVIGFTTAPLQLFTLVAMACAIGSLVLVLVLAGRRLVLGPEEGGLFTLLGLVFLLISLTMVGIGLIGEYVRRMYQLVQQRPRYIVREVLEQVDE